MTRVLRLSRLSLLLLLAVALIAVSVFLVNQDPPASADHGRDTEVWSATLTVKGIGQGALGCDSSSSTQALKCSNTATLTQDSFDLSGTSRTIAGIDLAPGSLIT